MPLNLPASEGGTLYVTATPIGNLEDLSPRALAALRDADLVLAEDTRRTRGLFAAKDIHTPLVSLHEHNERERTPMALARLARGERLALVSDAGTPGISDPGRLLIAEAAAAGFAVVPVPGPNAAVAALSASGLPAEPFYFLGFPHRKAGKRRAQLEALARLPATLVFYESPRRIAELLGELADTLGNRSAVLARELTKLHEEFLRGPLLDIQAALAVREEVPGECVLLVEGAPEPCPEDGATVEAAVREALASGESPSRAAARIAREMRVSRREVYGLAVRLGEEGG
jgi:16S rRNA (cytidine1402-2'-O)-methyltransferase